MADQIADLPALAARVDEPVVRVVDHIVESAALGAHHVEHDILAAVRHWVDRHGSFSFESSGQFRIALPSTSFGRRAAWASTSVIGGSERLETDHTVGI